ncbi:CRP-like cAMP-activated global transcriptional regulator [Burkholderiales bacterium]|nr:CRP-like cAMP-activated global transcriptional regulator [Burkholderiales bacterium]
MTVSPDTLHDAITFAAIALAVALVSFLFPPERRRGLLTMAVVASIGVGALWTQMRYQDTLGSDTIAVFLREFLLFVIAFAVIRVFMIFVLSTLLARFTVPRILSEFLLVILLIVYALFRLKAVGVNLAGIVTTSAVLSAALAFSAQETLGNLWAGISLQLENTVRLGDWIKVGNEVGQVVNIRWRSMAIVTNNNETIVIPNSVLMKDKVIVVARRGDERAVWRRSCLFSVDYDYTPARVCEAVTEALQRAEIPNVARDPAPMCLCEAYRESGAEYAAVYFLIDPRREWPTKSDVLAHIYAALVRAKMPIPYPRQVIELIRDERGRHAREDFTLKRAALDHAELFASLTPQEKDALAGQLRTVPFVADDIVFREGEQADSLYLLAHGRVHVVRDAPDGATRSRLATLDAPAYFGEMGLLLGAPRGATVVASGVVMCYQLDRRGFDTVLQARPQIATAMSEVLAERQAANLATMQALDAERARQAAGSAGDFVRKIREFFGLKS